MMSKIMKNQTFDFCKIIISYDFAVSDAISLIYNCIIYTKNNTFVI